MNCRAFADGIVLMAATPEGLQHKLSALEQFLAGQGLQVNTVKSLSLLPFISSVERGYW